MHPRIYVYKITFEEVPYYYYGSKKEKYYNQKYYGSPKANKWCWEFYTPKKQILEFFEYSDKGYEKCREIENRLIKPFLNDPYCLNERYGGTYSIDVLRKNGKKGGRPAEAGDRGTDDNAFGRDPLGKDDITRNFGRETRKERLVSKLKSISEKEKFLKDSIRKRIQSKYEKNNGKKVLNEDIDTQSEDSGSLLDDKNILTDI